MFQGQSRSLIDNSVLDETLTSFGTSTPTGSIGNSESGNLCMEWSESMCTFHVKASVPVSTSHPFVFHATHTHIHTHTYAPHAPVSSSTSSLGSYEGEELCKRLDDIDDLSLDFLEISNPTMEGTSTATGRVQFASVDLIELTGHGVTGTLRRKVLKRKGKSTSVSSYNQLCCLLLQWCTCYAHKIM